jgi:hypothetical protein
MPRRENKLPFPLNTFCVEKAVDGYENALDLSVDMGIRDMEAGETRRQLTLGMHVVVSM